MTISEFIEVTKTLEKYYEKELDEFQRKVWYDEIKYMTEQRYRQIVRHILITSKFMPKLSDVVQANNSLGKIQKEVKEKVECSKCNGEGFILYTEMVDNGDTKIPYQYVARCECANGEEFNYDGRTIKDTEHRSNYYIPSLVELGL